MNNILDGLAIAPDSQIDASIKVRLVALKQLPQSEQKGALKKILDDCTYYSLASDFAMKAMDITWKMMP